MLKQQIRLLLILIVISGCVFKNSGQTDIQKDGFSCVTNKKYALNSSTCIKTQNKIVLKNENGFSQVDTIYTSLNTKLYLKCDTTQRSTIALVYEVNGESDYLTDSRLGTFLYDAESKKMVVLKEFIIKDEDILVIQIFKGKKEKKVELKGSGNFNFTFLSELDNVKKNEFYELIREFL